MLAESEVDEELVCETSANGYFLRKRFANKSRRSTQMEGSAEWSATGFENQGVATTTGVRFLHLPSLETEQANLSDLQLSNFLNDDLSIGKDCANNVNSGFLC